MNITDAAVRAPVLLFAVLCDLGTAPAAAEDTWYPSRYGAEDTIGAANNLSPAIVREAATLIRTGKVYSLAVDARQGQQHKRHGHRTYQVLLVSRPGSGKRGTNETTAFDDLVCAWQGIGTNMDGLGHVGVNFVHYNGNRVDEIYDGPNGLRKLSIHAVPPIVTRGVLLDMAKYLNVEIVSEGTVFNRAELEGAARRQKVEIRTGDVVLLHTGWINLLETDPERSFAAMPGLGKDGARYLAGLGVVAVGADTHGVEVIPAENREEHAPVHELLLVKHGVYLLENVDTRALAVDGGYEFLFVLGQPRLVGAGQAIVNPIAIR